MVFIGIFIAIILILIFLILQSRIYVIIQVNFTEAVQKIEIEFQLYGICLKRKLIDLNAAESDLVEAKINNLKGIRMKWVKEQYQLIKALLVSVTIHKIRWKTSIGLGDAAITASLAGLLWAIKDIGINFLRIKSNLKAVPELSIIPNYTEQQLESTIHCILSMKIGQTIFGIIKQDKVRTRV